MTKTISIYEREFTVPQPYNEGHVLTAIEAKQLNQVFAENIANNQRSNIKKAIDADEARSKGEPVAEDAPTFESAVETFNKYASEYAFTEASAGGSTRTMTPLEKECKKLATAVVIQLLEKSGRKRKDVTKEDFDAEVARIADTDKVKKMATKNLKDLDNLAGAVGAESEQAAA